jgi:hypothetical protein
MRGSVERWTRRVVEVVTVCDAAPTITIAAPNHSQFGMNAATA